MKNTPHTHTCTHTYTHTHTHTHTYCTHTHTHTHTYTHTHTHTHTHAHIHTHTHTYTHTHTPVLLFRCRTRSRNPRLGNKARKFKGVLLGALWSTYICGLLNLHDCGTTSCRLDTVQLRAALTLVSAFQTSTYVFSYTFLCEKVR